MDDIQVLDDWLSLPDVGRELGVTRGRVHQMVTEGVIPSDKVRKVGDIIVVDSAFVAELRRSRET